MTKAQLRMRLMELGLPVSGMKAELAQRLLEAPPDAAEGGKVAALEVSVGDEVEVNFEGSWFVCTVLEVSIDGRSCAVRYRGGGEDESGVDTATRIRKLEPPWVKRGMKVEAEYEGKWWPCKVLWVSQDGRMCTAKYDEGGDVEKHIDITSRVRRLPGCEAEYEASRIAFDSLRVGQRLAGIVTTARDFGIFVDVGTDRDGFVPRARASAKFVEDLRGVASAGDEVEVWVSRIGEDGKLELAMTERKVRAKDKTKSKKDLSGFVGAAPDQWLQGKVTGFRTFGLFVEVEPPLGGLPQEGVVHITEIREGFVTHPSNEGYKVGQEVKVRVTQVDAEAGRLNLSLKKPAVA